MIRFSLTKLAAASGCLALSLTAGVGVASAAPNLDPIVNTTCSYPQVQAALNAQDPAAAAEFNQSPFAQSYLRRFLASPPAKRQQMAEEVQGIPQAQEYIGLIGQVAGTCNNF